MRIHSHTMLMSEAARALARRDGDAFNTLIQTNQDWLQQGQDRDAYDAALRTMQEAAYLLEGEPTECTDITDDDSDD